MPDNKNVAERHGCLVCGRMYDMLVVYGPGGQFVDCRVMSAGGRRVPDAHRPLVACNTHSAAEIEAAYLQHYPGRQEKDADDD